MGSIQVSWQRISHFTHFVFRSRVTRSMPMCSGGPCIIPGQMCGQLPPLCTLHNQCALGTIFTFNNVRGEFCPDDCAFGREEGGSIRFQTKCVIRIKNMGLSVFQAKRDIIGIKPQIWLDNNPCESLCLYPSIIWSHVNVTINRHMQSQWVTPCQVKTKTPAR